MTMTAPADLLRQEVMLASPGKDPEALLTRLHEQGRFVFDVKWDGVRALAHVWDGNVTLRNRDSRDITHRYPDVVKRLLEVYPSDRRVLDGELLVWNGERFDFNLALRRDAQGSAHRISLLAEEMPATFMAFDLLWRDDVDLRSRPLNERLAILKEEPATTCVQHSHYSVDAPVMWQAVKRFGFEGLIAKDAQSRYHGGRQMSWVKLKRLSRVTAIVTGWEPGKRAGEVGCLHVSLYDAAGVLVPVGSVGTGFRAADHRALLEVLPTGAKFLVEVEYLEFTHDGRLRNPSYKGVRFDVTAADCTLDQVKEVR